MCCDYWMKIVKTWRIITWLVNKTKELDFIIALLSDSLVYSLGDLFTTDQGKEVLKQSVLLFRLK